MVLPTLYVSMCVKERDFNLFSICILCISRSCCDLAFAADTALNNQLVKQDEPSFGWGTACNNNNRDGDNDDDDNNSKSITSTTKIKNK